MATTAPVAEVREEAMHDIVMKNMLGLDHIPVGYKVCLRDGDPRNVQRENLYLKPISR